MPFNFPKTGGKRDIPGLPPWPRRSDEREQRVWFEKLYDALRGAIATPGVVNNNFNITIFGGGGSGTPGTPGAPGDPGTIGPVLPDLVVFGGPTGGLAQDTNFFYQTAIDRVTVPRVRLIPIIVDGPGDGSPLPLYPPLQFDPDSNGNSLTFIPLSGAIEYDGSYYYGTNNVPLRRPFLQAGSINQPPIVGPFDAYQLLFGSSTGNGGIEQDPLLTWDPALARLGVGVAIANAPFEFRSPLSSQEMGVLSSVLSSNSTGSYLGFWVSSGLSLTSQYGRIGVTHNGSGSDTIMTGEAADTFAITSRGTYPLQLGTALLPRMTITAGGLVGVGHVPTAARLSVSSSTEQATRFTYDSGATATGNQLVSELIATSTANVTTAQSYGPLLRFSFADSANILNNLAEIRTRRAGTDVDGELGIAIGTTATGMTEMLRVLNSGELNVGVATGTPGAGTVNTAHGCFKNGVEYLTAAGGGITGTISVGQVAYGDTVANTIKGISTFIFDGTHLGIGLTTPTYALDVTAAAVASPSLEKVVRLQVSDVSTDYFELGNATTTAAQFIAGWTGFHSSDNRYAMIFYGRSPNAAQSGINYPVILFDASVNGSTAITARPIAAFTSGTSSSCAVWSSGRMQLDGTIGDIQSTTIPTPVVAGLDIVRGDYPTENWSGGWAGNLRLKATRFPSLRLFATNANRTVTLGNDNDGSLWIMPNATGDTAGGDSVTISTASIAVSANNQWDLGDSTNKFKIGWFHTRVDVAGTLTITSASVDSNTNLYLNNNSNGPIITGTGAIDLNGHTTVTSPKNLTVYAGTIYMGYGQRIASSPVTGKSVVYTDATNIDIGANTTDERQINFLTQAAVISVRTTGLLQFGAMASDPSGVEGGVYYNSGAKTLKVYLNGSWVTIQTA